MSQVRRIALLLGQDLGYCRGVFHGIQSYAAEGRNWVFRDGPPDRTTLGPLKGWKPHGVIAHLFLPDVAADLAKLRVPVVNTTSTLLSAAYAVHKKTSEAPTVPDFPLVEVDHMEVGRLAAEHFLERGFQSFGYFGSSWTHFSQMRERGFRMRLAEAGFAASSCYAEYLPRLAAKTSWKGIDQRVRRWLRPLAKPVGILASNDIPARDLAEMCRQLGLRVPDDVALVGVDNDRLQCGLTFPPLSSVSIPAERIGYEAARLLDGLMVGKKPPSGPMLLPPLHVVTRQSTDIVAIDDRDVARALARIRRDAARQLTVSEVARQAGVGRRVLERKFQTLLGSTILKEIRRARIQYAKELLADTDLPIQIIASQVGFSGPQRLSLAFRQLTGMAPSAYRRQSQVHQGATSPIGRV